MEDVDCILSSVRMMLHARISITITTCKYISTFSKLMVCIILYDYILEISRIRFVISPFIYTCHNKYFGMKIISYFAGILKVLRYMKNFLNNNKMLENIFWILCVVRLEKIYMKKWGIHEKVMAFSFVCNFFTAVVLEFE